MRSLTKYLKSVLTRWRQERGGPPVERSSPETQPLDDEPLASDQDPFLAPVVWEITDQIDLHHVAPREIKAVVAAYLIEAHEHGFRCVRIIHGKGIGVQRNAVRGVLAETPFVKEFHDAPDASGWGATIASFFE